jgi:hypothetical protein
MYLLHKGPKHFGTKNDLKSNSQYFDLKSVGLWKVLSKFCIFNNYIQFLRNYPVFLTKLLSKSPQKTTCYYDKS